MSDAPRQPSRDDADRLLAHAQRVSDSALAGVGWRSVATLVGLGATTSIGTLAMNLSTGPASFTMTTVMIVRVLIIMVGGVCVGNKYADSLDFGTIRTAVQVTDSALSKQITILEEAGIVGVKKGFVGKRPRSWVQLTLSGRAAWGAHLGVLREISSGLGGAV